MAGFTSGEGYFGLIIKKSENTKSGMQVVLRFELAQHIRDKQLIKNLVYYFGCGIYISSGEAAYYRCDKFINIKEKVVPFFQKYKILGVKSLDFHYGCLAAEIMSNRQHLTPEGFERICKIRSRMNKERVSDLKKVKQDKCININMPENNILITKSWLVGFVFFY
jgi:hypothetical protein